MTFKPTTTAAATALLGVALGGLACTAIFAPRDDVERCGTADDCPDTGDNRYISECRFDPEGEENIDSTEVDKICVAAYETPSCAFQEMDPSDPLAVAVEMFKNDGHLVSCDLALGSRGCPPEQGMPCNDGLEVSEFNVCDDTDPNTPPAYGNTSAHGVPFEELLIQDTLDQFCRSFFCEDDFVCDRDDDTCVRCDPEDDFGRGGCGKVYSEGAPSCVYQLGDALQAACPAPDSARDTVSWGTCP